MWYPDALLEQMYKAYETKRNERKSAQSLEERRLFLRQQAQKLLGEFPEPDALCPVLLERTEFEDYIRERVEYGTYYGLRVPAYVLVPRRRQGRLPAVQAIHGHGYGSRQIVGLAPDGTELAGEPDLHGSFALALVKKGFVVLAPEVIGFGDRRMKAELEEGQVGSDSCYTLSSHLLLYGATLAGLRVHEALRGLDYLLTREEADAKRAGCIGFSGGALITAYAAGMDERIRAAVVCGFTNTFKGSIMHVRHCIDNYIPGILQVAELPEWIGLIAPRPLFIESGENDPIFPVDTFKEAVNELQRIYREYGAGERLDIDLFPGVHEVSGKKAFAWLQKQL